MRGQFKDQVETNLPTSPLQTAVEEGVQKLVATYHLDGLTAASLSLTVIDLTQQPAVWANHRGDALVYPASIIKLFFLVAVHAWEDTGKLIVTSEVKRACHDMIVDSSNDATSLIVDLLTGTTSGPDLMPSVFVGWQRQRQVLNRYFQAMGVAGNFCQKTWSDGPYGRDYQSYAGGRNRNALTTNGTAWLWQTIAAEQAISPQRSRAMLALLRRDLDPSTYQDDPDNQIEGFLGEGLPRNAHLWSKAGETSFSRHDSALIQLPNGAAYILVVFGDGPAYFKNKAWLPELSRYWVDYFTATGEG